MATRDSTNNDWWSNKGVVRSKATIIFADNTSIDVYGSDYIKSWKVTQDLSSVNDKPVFDFVSDKLEMTLYSLDNDFNPFAENSQYYGKFTIGTKVNLFTKVDYLGHGDELNWDALGQYKIAEIDVNETGTVCEVLAYDYGYDGIENSRQQILSPLYDIKNQKSVLSFFKEIFPGYNVTIESGVSELPLKLFTLSNKLETINELLVALYCFTRCNGNEIEIKTFGNINEASLGVSNIVSLSPKQSSVKQYKASTIKWNEIGLQSGTEIVSIVAEFDKAGAKSYNNITFGQTVNKIEETICTSVDGSEIVGVDITDVYSNALTLIAENAKAGKVDIKVRAETITFNEILEGELNSAEEICEISNKYIQTKQHAAAIKAKVDKFISTKNQYCGAEIRFNPLLKLAGLVNCQHDYYDVNMNGYIVEQTFEISDGAPSGRHSIMLLNKEAIL